MSTARKSDAGSSPNSTGKSSATAWLGARGLTLNAIALWNSIYIQAALHQLTREGWDIVQADIARVSPLTFKHINFLGRYAFDLPQAIAEGALRPLRNPNSE